MRVFLPIPYDASQHVAILAGPDEFAEVHGADAGLILGIRVDQVHRTVAVDVAQRMLGLCPNDGHAVTTFLGKGVVAWLTQYQRYRAGRRVQ